jgi:hypothetical protein
VRKIILIVAGVTALLNVSPAQNDTAGWGQKSSYNRHYDVKTVTKIEGEITAVEQIMPMKGMSRGVHLTVKSKNESHSVHLGPEWYMKQQNIQFKTGDKVEVQGSKTTVNEKPVIIAKEIIKEGTTLKLRDENGIPVWAGRGKR